jgi:hypothetical protein
MAVARILVDRELQGVGAGVEAVGVHSPGVDVAGAVVGDRWPPSPEPGEEEMWSTARAIADALWQ